MGRLPLQQVRTHTRAIPLGADVILGDLLREAAAPVYTAEGLDADDIVAKIAHELGRESLILSADRDMFRYDLADVHKRVMSDFAFTGKDGEALVLIPSRAQQPKEGVAPRALADVPYEPEKWQEPYNKIKLAVKFPERGYVRGADSPVTRRHGGGGRRRCKLTVCV